MVKNKRSRKGFMIVEATILIPVFMIAILTLGCLIPVMAIKERIMNTYASSASDIAKASYTSTLTMVPKGVADGIAGGAAARVYLVSKICGDNSGIGAASMKSLELRGFRYLYKSNEIDGLISGEFIYKYKIPFPILFYRDFELSEYLIYRGFIGNSLKSTPMPFEAMSDNDNDEMVIIFPRHGERYHDIECRIVSVYPLEMILTKQLVQKYNSCKICDSGELSYGSLVYCFMSEGKAYHKGNCPAVDKYIIEVKKEEAENEGYTPCTLCR